MKNTPEAFRFSGAAVPYERDRRLSLFLSIIGKVVFLVLVAGQLREGDLNVGRF